MSMLKHRVLMLAALGFVTGIAASSFVRFAWLASALGAAACLSAVCFQRARSPAIFAVGLLLGALRYDAFLPPGSQIESWAGPSPVSIYGQVATEPSLDSHKATFLLSAAAIRTHSGSYRIEGMTEVLVHGAALPSIQHVHFDDQVWASGLLQTVFPATNPGEYDWRVHQRHRGITGELVVQRPSGAVIVGRSIFVNAFDDWTERADRYFGSLFSRYLPTQESSLLLGIMFGDRAQITPELQRSFAVTGTAHVLATAGLHVGIICLCLNALFGVLPISRKAGAAGIIVFLWAFAAIAGDRASVVRAVAAATIYFAARIFERVPDLPTALAAAALVILSARPLDLFDSDFQLSFVTVAGLALLMPYWDWFWKPMLETAPRGLPRSLAQRASELVGLSILAQLCSSPLTVYYFSQVSLLSLPVNVIVVPLLFIVIPVALLSIVVGAAVPPVCPLIARLFLHPLLWTILHTVSWFAGQSWCSIALAPPPAFAIAAMYVLVYGAALFLRQPVSPATVGELT